MCDGCSRKTTRQNRKKQREENASESKRRPRDSSREMCVLIAAICWSLLSSFARSLAVQLEKRHPIRRRMAVISICNSTDSIFCPLSQEWLGLIPIITGEEAVNYLFGISTCFLYLMCSLSSTEGAPFFCSHPGPDMKWISVFAHRIANFNVCFVPCFLLTRPPYPPPIPSPPATLL